MSSHEDSAYLSDRPIAAEADNRFDHLEYVDCLEKMVLAADPPWYIEMSGSDCDLLNIDIVDYRITHLIIRDSCC